MKVKFSINPRLRNKLETSYKSCVGSQVEIQGCANIGDFLVAIRIKSTLSEIQKDNAGASFESFDSILKDYPQHVSGLLYELITDLDNRGESESTWFDFSFSMQTKNGDCTIYENASSFDFVSYYNDLQAQKSSMLLNGGGFEAIISLEQNNVHESFLPVLGDIFNPNA